MKKINSTSIAITLILAGCAAQSPTPAKAPKNELTAEKVRTFPKNASEYKMGSGKNAILLTDSKVFLWPTNGDLATTVKLVKQLSYEIGKRSEAAIDLQSKLKGVEAQLSQIPPELIARFQEPAQKLVESELALKKAKAALKKAQTEQKSQDEINELELAVQAAQNERQASKQAVEELAKQIGADPSPLLVGKTMIQTESAENEKIAKMRVEQLTFTVDYYAQMPSSVLLEFNEQSEPKVVMDGWNPCYLAAGSTATTIDRYKGQEENCDKYYVTAVRYTEEGGQLEFDVVFPKLMDLYHFSMIRSRYNDKFNRVYFDGKVQLVDVSNPLNPTPLRQGHATFATKIVFQD